MVFSTTTFLLLFFPVVLAVYYLPFVKKRRKLSNFILTVSSIFFYAWGEPVFVLVMLGSILLNWAFGLIVNKYLDIDNKKAKAAVGISAAFNIAILFVFKYLTFTIENINSWFHKDFDTLNIALPIGISFYTFQLITYCVDVYRGDALPQRSFKTLLLYVSLFHQCIAGPIVRYKDVCAELENRRARDCRGH